MVLESVLVSLEFWDFSVVAGGSEELTSRRLSALSYLLRIPINKTICREKMVSLVSVRQVVIECLSFMK